MDTKISPKMITSIMRHQAEWGNVVLFSFIVNKKYQFTVLVQAGPTVFIQ